MLSPLIARVPSPRASGIDRALTHLLVPGSHFCLKQRGRETKEKRTTKRAKSSGSEFEANLLRRQQVEQVIFLHLLFFFPLCLFSFSSSFFPQTIMRSSVLSSRRGVAPARGASGLSRARVAVAAASSVSVAPLQRRRLAFRDLPTTMKTKAVSGDETGLLTALSAAPPEAVAALGAGESPALKVASKCTLL